MDHRSEYQHLVRYSYFGTEHVGLDTVASVTGLAAAPGAARRRRTPEVARRRTVDGAMAVDEVLLGLGDGITRVQRKQYRADQRLRNFACVCPPQRTKLLVYLKADLKQAAG